MPIQEGSQQDIFIPQFPSRDVVQHTVHTHSAGRCLGSWSKDQEKDGDPLQLMWSLVEDDVGC